MGSVGMAVNKRREIMQAAEKLLATRRFHEIPLDDIVREAHVGKGTIYAYFKDKDDLFFQVAMAGFEEMRDLLRQRVADDAPFRQQLLQAGQVIAAFFARRRQLFRMIQSEDARMSRRNGGNGLQWEARRNQLVEILAQVLRRGQAERQVRDDLPADVLANLFLGLLRTRARRLGGEASAMDDALLVEFFLHGAGSQGAAPHSHCN